MIELSIKERRIKRGWTQKELAGKVGVSLSTIKRWEQYGIKDSGDATISTILIALDTTTKEDYEMLDNFLESYIKDKEKILIMSFKNYNGIIKYLELNQSIYTKQKYEEVYFVYLTDTNIRVMGFNNENNEGFSRFNIRDAVKENRIIVDYDEYKKNRI